MPLHQLRALSIIVDACCCAEHIATSHSSLVLKSFLLDPLITAAITRRLDQIEPTTLAAALSQRHEWKVRHQTPPLPRRFELTSFLQANEVTRHLSALFASPQFRPRVLSDSASRKIQTALLRLVVALSNSSLAAAVSSRVVEKLMPFYGGTLSADDTMLLDLFQRLELVGGGSISIAFKAWNPSLEQAPLENSRAASLANAQASYARRSWLRICASSRTTFPKEHADITYDSQFLLQFVAHTIAEDEVKAADWIAILETGVLGILVAALASSSASTRLVARGAIKVALTKLEVRSFIPVHRSCFTDSVLARFRRRSTSGRRTRLSSSSPTLATASTALKERPSHPSSPCSSPTASKSSELPNRLSTLPSLVSSFNDLCSIREMYRCSTSCSTRLVMIPWRIIGGCCGSWERVSCGLRCVAVRTTRVDRNAS